MSKVHCKPQRRDYANQRGGGHSPRSTIVETKRPKRAYTKPEQGVANLATAQPMRNPVVIDARPITAERQRMEVLRQHKGLVAAWTAEINRMEEDLKVMAYRLMDQIAEWLVMRPAKSQLARSF